MARRTPSREPHTQSAPLAKWCPASGPDRLPSHSIFKTQRTDRQTRRHCWPVRNFESVAYLPACVASSDDEAAASSKDTNHHTCPASHQSKPLLRAPDSPIWVHRLRCWAAGMGTGSSASLLFLRVEKINVQQQQIAC